MISHSDKTLEADHFNRRIRELRAILLDEDEAPLRETSVQAAADFLQKPGIVATPTGEIECRWKWPDGKLLVVRFVEKGSPWILKRPSRPSMSPTPPPDQPKPEE